MTEGEKGWRDGKKKREKVREGEGRDKRGKSVRVYA